MEWIHYVSYFLGGAFLTNAVRYFVMAAGLGVLLRALLLARSFGRFHGGHSPRDS